MSISDRRGTGRWLRAEPAYTRRLVPDSPGRTGSGPTPAGESLGVIQFGTKQAYTFGRGHRIMVQVQSTWFPLYDRKPQTFVPNIFDARTTDYGPQTHRVYRTAAQPSNVEVTVLR